MNPTVVVSRRVTTLLSIAITTLLAGCARSNSVDSVASQRVESSVFSDTALYRQHCVEADSGLTPLSGRCTPRDQRLRVP